MERLLINTAKSSMLWAAGIHFPGMIATKLTKHSKQAVVEVSKQLINSGRYSYDKEGNRGEGWLCDDKMDCSEFVIQCYRQAGFVDFPLLNSHGMANQFSSIGESKVEVGDIIYWSSGHVGIVVDPVQGIFAGAQTKQGLGTSSYKSGYWAKHSSHRFLRYTR